MTIQLFLIMKRVRKEAKIKHGYFIDFKMLKGNSTPKNLYKGNNNRHTQNKKATNSEKHL